MYYKCRLSFSLKNAVWSNNIFQTNGWIYLSISFHLVFFSALKFFSFLLFLLHSFSFIAIIVHLFQFFSAEYHYAYFAARKSNWF